MKRLKAVLLAGVCLSVFFSLQGQEQKTLSAHLPPISRSATLEQRLDSATRLNLTLGLRLPDPASLDNFVRDIYNPASPNYHHYLTPSQFADRFGPSETDYQKVIQFAQTHGFSVVTRHDGRMVLEVSAAAADVEKAFGVRLLTHQHPTENRRYFAADRAPSIPSEIPILDISGLEDFSSTHPLLAARPLDEVSSYSPEFYGSGPDSSYTATDLRGVYEMNVAIDGTGQSVGLLEFDTFFPADVRMFEKEEGLPATPIRTVALPGVTGIPGRDNAEPTLDVDMAIGMAPGIASVIVYQSPQAGSIRAQFDGLLIRMAEDDAASQLSSSWSPPLGHSSLEVQIFEQMAAQGQTFFQSAGDFGAYTNGVSQESENPYMTIVGGTELGPYDEEGVWNNGASNQITGGGFLTNYTIPSWQTGVDMAAVGGSTNWRNSPDVAAAADGVYARYNNGRRAIFFGTSLSAPIWAGFTALINQQAESNDLPPVGFLNPILYAICLGPNYNIALRDITSGNNTSALSPNNFSAASGYDLCTGWGSPNGQGLLDALTVNRSQLVITPADPFSAIGNVGGPFSTNEVTYSLIDNGWSPLTWSLGALPNWLSASTNARSIAPYQTNTLTISFNSATTNLSAGVYSTNVIITNLADGTTQSLSFNLQLFQSSAVQVTLSPPEAVAAGALWNVDSGPWQTNGAIVSPVYTSNHIINFASIPNWNTPASQPFTPSGAQTNQFTGVYTPQSAWVSVILGPPDAIVAGAAWQVDGGPWMTGALPVAVSALTNHLITFSSIPGWIPPSPELVTIYGNQANVLTEAYSEVYQFSTIAGTPGTNGSADGTNRAAQFSSPNGIALDPSGNLFVVDTGNAAIRKLTRSGTNWVVTTIAGKAGDFGTNDGAGPLAQFNSPNGVALNPNGNLYVTDTGNETVRSLTPSGTNWLVSTIAGAPGQNSEADGGGGAGQFDTPFAIACNGSNTLYVTDLNYRGRLRTLSFDGTNWETTTVMTETPAGTILPLYFADPVGVAVASGVGIIVSIPSEIDALVTRFNDNYPSYYTASQLLANWGSFYDFNVTSEGLALDSLGNIYCAESGSDLIYKLIPSGNSQGLPTYTFTTIGGSPFSAGTADGPGNVARFNGATSLAVDTNGNLFISDTGNGAIRMGISLFNAVQILAAPTNEVVQSAQFQIDGGPWTPIGSTVRLFQSSHTISFSPIPGFATPSNQIVTISSSATITGIYTQQFGSLTVNLSPPGALTAGAAWQLDGGPWQSPGTTLSNLLVGAHSLNFSNLTKWVAPASASISIGPVATNSSFAYLPADLQNPTVAITSPRPGQIWTNQQVTIEGTAADNIAVAAVFFRLNNGIWVQVYGTNDWISPPEPMPSGTVVAQAYAQDTSGNTSKLATVQFLYTPEAPINAAISGQGSISKISNGQALSVGKNYTLTATPARGWIFTDWSGDFPSTNPKLSFTVATNSFLQANFEPNPFAPIAGLYQGLFYNSNNLVQSSSGFFSAQLTTQGAYSASISLQGVKHSFSGQFNPQGAASNQIARAFSPISLQLSLDLAGSNGITGRLTSPDWQSSLAALRSPFSKTDPAPQAGRYTLRFPSPETSRRIPGGDGIGAATISPLGAIQFAGTLGDGSAASQNAAIVGNNQWPFYASVDDNSAVILGWLNFTNLPDHDLTGSWTWIKTPQINASYYPDGFSLHGIAEGSTYTQTKGAAVLPYSSAAISFSNADLASDFTNQLTLKVNNTILNQSPNPLTLSISPATGLFHGTVTIPGSHTNLPFSGAIFQKQNSGYGLFFDANKSGSLILQQAP